MVETTISSKSDRVLISINTLLPLQEEIEKIVSMKENYQILLLEPQLLFAYRKSFISFAIALRLYNKCKASKRLDSNEIRIAVSSIAQIDKEFAKELDGILPNDSSTSWVFADLVQALGQGKTHFVSYISTNLEELNVKAKSIADAKISKQLVTLFSIISGHEVDILMRYKNDCNNWAGYALKYDINFFIRRLNLYLRGGFEDNEKYFGIVSNFGDEELARNILKKPIIRNLWRYNEQIKYFNLLIGLCRKSEESGEWKGFWGKRALEENNENEQELGFWGKNGDEKGRNFDRHAELFETKYGNVEFRKLLETNKKKIGESPEGWGGSWEGDKIAKPGFLQELLARLQHQSYQRQKIIIPASVELYKLLEARESELIGKKEKSVEELIELLERMSGIGLSAEKVLGGLKGLLNRRRRIILNRLNNDVNEFSSKAQGFVADYESYTKNLDAILSKIYPQFMMKHLEKLYQISMANLKYVWQQISRGSYLNDIRAGVLTAGADRAAHTAWFQRGSFIRFEHLDEDDFRKMEVLIQEARALLANLNQIHIYILPKLKVDYMPAANEFPSNYFQNIRNKDFEFDYVKGVLKRLIR